jgi:hypothetical protein
MQSRNKAETKNKAKKAETNQKQSKRSQKSHAESPRVRRLSGHGANIEVVSLFILVQLQYSGGFVKAQSRMTSATTYRPVGSHTNIC